MKLFKGYDRSSKNFLLSCLILILFAFMLFNIDAIEKSFIRIISVCYPFILGFGIAFFLNPIVKFFEYNLFSKINFKQSTKHVLSCVTALIVALLFLGFLIGIIVPQFAGSLANLADKSSSYLSSFSNTINEFSKQYHLSINTDELIGNSTDFLDWIIETLDSAKIIPQFAAMSIGLFKALFQVLVGIVAGLYLLIDRDKFLSNVKKVNYTLLPNKYADYTYETCMIARDVFYDFVIGKAIDSLIIGLLCFAGLSLMHIEYAGLLSIIVGATNMIPVFGPFIGAVPGIFILLIIDPIHALIFAIFILILQQIDGNVIGPLILGDKLGLPSFWILFSVTIGGAFFGVIGMFFGVPIFTVIYKMFAKYISTKSKSKLIEQ